MARRTFSDAVILCALFTALFVAGCVVSGQSAHEQDTARTPQVGPAEGPTESEVKKYLLAVEVFEQEAAMYRDSNIVFREFQVLFSEKITPMLVAGEMARLRGMELAGTLEAEGFHFDYEAIRPLVGKSAAYVFRNVFPQFQRLADAGVISLDEEEQRKWRQLVWAMGEYSSEQPPENPFDAGTHEHMCFVREVGVGICNFMSGLAPVTMKLPPALEARKMRIEQLHAKLRDKGWRLPGKRYAEPYVAALQEGFERVSQVTEFYYQAKKEPNSATAKELLEELRKEVGGQDIR